MEALKLVFRRVHAPGPAVSVITNDLTDFLVLQYCITNLARACLPVIAPCHGNIETCDTSVSHVTVLLPDRMLPHGGSLSLLYLAS
jgi:hypothetical protein